MLCRQSELALFDKRVRLDSSLNWVFGETIEEEVDAVVSLWSEGKHVFRPAGYGFLDVV